MYEKSAKEYRYLIDFKIIQNYKNHYLLMFYQDRDIHNQFYKSIQAAFVPILMHMLTDELYYRSSYRDS